ncbi:Alpha-D-kanosaminyltransferase [Rubripirellula tenax]|uniref:Alpha-D-kanosaminyltransferase n=1 Tax=Rubripirellula tenax TaxID=2528015 RepID=A0A5C6F8S4_9BACT|nr:glycosyltransferase family 4 protein [Rubripirellula tenax]TWU56874.1 Alpha-D-kanosaminyltransferase [Rubripirellula tenax]
MSVYVEPQPEAVPRTTQPSKPEFAGKIAYLVNQYPVPSGTFIRREIEAMESFGIKVVRFAIRQTNVRLSEPKDLVEASRTRIVLDLGLLGPLVATFATMLTKPITFVKALALTIRMGWHSDRGLLVNFAYLLEACQLTRWLIREDVEHLHVHYGSNPASVALLCRALGGPRYSFTLHGPHEFDKPHFLRLGEKVARSKFAVAISEYGRSQLYRWTDREHWDKIHVVHCGLDRAYFSEELTPPPSDPRLVFIGRLDEQKGTHLLVEAAKMLKDGGCEFELVMVGDGPFRGELENMIRRYGLESNVRLAGWQNDVEVRQSLLDSRALVLSSFAEGLPVVIMESLAMGRPVISTNIAGVAELVQPGVCGWLVPAGAIEPLAKRMREAIEMPVEELAQYGKAGAQLVSESHQAVIEAAKLARLIGLTEL